MKLFHLADLHIGKTVNKFSMLEDQKHILTQILDAIDEQNPDAIMIAGDIYDQIIPSGAAVSLFDDFLTELTSRNIIVMYISGNHDSSERLEYASRILKNNHIYIAGVFDGSLRKITFEDTYGKINFYLLPFVRPANVRAYYPDERISSYSDAIEVVLKNTLLDSTERNILIAHQFVLPISGDVERSDSEIEPVGGLNSVPAGLFDEFDYVALGHLHGPQNLGSERVRYSGSPLKYSFSETSHKKSITVLDIQEKGKLLQSFIPLIPLHDMRKIKGPFSDITSKEILIEGDVNDYMHITLTDEDEIVDAIGKIRRFYPNVMELSFDNRRTRHEADLSEQLDIERKSPMILFENFFKEQNGVELSETQKSITETLLKELEDELI